MYLDAFSLMEEENREVFAKDMYFSAIALQLKKKNWDEVTTLLMRWAEACDRAEQPGSQAKVRGVRGVRGEGSVGMPLRAGRRGGSGARPESALGVMIARLSPASSTSWA